MLTKLAVVRFAIIDFIIAYQIVELVIYFMEFESFHSVIMLRAIDFILIAIIIATTIIVIELN